MIAGVVSRGNADAPRIWPKPLSLATTAERVERFTLCERCGLLIPLVVMTIEAKPKSLEFPIGTILSIAGFGLTNIVEIFSTREFR